MGVRNHLIEGVSGTGKTPACGEPADGHRHEHHLWRADRVRSLVAGQADAVAFFCGGSRNSSTFIDLFDGVFVPEVGLGS